jgi:hypothetical protein
MVQTGLGKNETISLITGAKMADGMPPEVEHLPSKCKAYYCPPNKNFIKYTVII